MIRRRKRLILRKRLTHCKPLPQEFFYSPFLIYSNVSLADGQEETEKGKEVKEEEEETWKWRGVINENYMLRL